MQFRTPVPISKNNSPIDYSSKIISLGSCFAVNMAEKLHYFKFENWCNPFGILFHPLAIEKLIEFAVSEKEFTVSDIFFHDEQWHCFDAHSDLSNPNSDSLLSDLNAIIKSMRQQMFEATHVVITYGTAWVYRNIDNDEIVANCHKVPQKQFEKELLSVEIIRESVEKTIDLIHSVNPNCKIIFTVSPVRHIKDGFVENQLSKAHLISGIHQLISDKNKITSYFPSYEIMMDELRDYRFYAEDMLHPSSVAIDYIWKRFKETNVSEQSFLIMDEVETIQKSLLHRPFNPNSESHRKFENNLKEKISKLVLRYPFMKF